MIKGTGVDIVEISRMEKAMKSSERFAARVFSPGEIAYCNGKKNKWASLAARFAAKEAAVKALGAGFGRIKLTDIEVVNNENGKPALVLHGAALAASTEQRLTCLSLSLSHCKDYAIAFVVAY